MMNKCMKNTATEMEAKKDSNSSNYQKLKHGISILN